MKKGITAAFGLLLCFAGATAQALPAPQAPAAAAAPTPAPPFSESLVGRFETVAVGSFPIALFYSGIGYDLAAYARSGGDPLYAPWPFKSAQAPALSNEERLARIGTAALLSLSIALLDAFLFPKAMEKRRAERTGTLFPSPPEPSAQGGSQPKDGLAEPQAPPEAPTDPEPASIAP